METPNWPFSLRVTRWGSRCDRITQCRPHTISGMLHGRSLICYLGPSSTHAAYGTCSNHTPSCILRTLARPDNVVSLLALVMLRQVRIYIGVNQGSGIPCFREVQPKELRPCRVPYSVVSCLPPSPLGPVARLGLISLLGQVIKDSKKRFEFCT